MNQTKSSVLTEAVGRNAPCRCGSGLKYKKCCLSIDEAQHKTQTGEDALIVCMPTRGQVCYETMLALLQNLQDVKHAVLTIGRRPVVEARNILAKHVLTVREKRMFPFEPREYFVLWCDDDSWWPANAVSTMLSAFHARPDVDAIFGKFGGRGPYGEPFAYRDRTDKTSFPKAGIDCAFGELVPIQRAGFHWVLMRLSLLERMGENPFDVPEGESLPEDFAFCDRACAIGARLFMAEGCPIVHIDPRDGAAYLPGMPAMMMDENSVRAGGFATAHIVPGIGTKEIEVRSYGDEIKPLQQRAEREGEVWLQEVEKRQRVSARAV